MIDIFLASSPIIIIMLLTFFFKKPLFIISPFVFLYTSLIAFIFWKIEINFFYISLFKGFFVAFDILIIIFGALFFLEFLKKTGAMEAIKERLVSVSKDARIIAILVVWFFGSFIEGVAGFGMPAAITAPLLLSLGFNPILAVSIALVGNSTAVAFGAVGTPIRIGFAAIESGMAEIAIKAAFINIFPGIFVPLMIASLVVLSRKDWKFSEIKEIIPFSFLAGLSFLIPYFFFSLLGQEFPSLAGSLLGIIIIYPFLKKEFLFPKEKIVFNYDAKEREKGNDIKGLIPYFLLISFLIIGKIYMPSIEVSLLGEVNHSFNLFNPGLAFLLSIFISFFIFKISSKEIKTMAVKSFEVVLIPFVVILFIASFVQIMNYSENNKLGKEGMIETFSEIIVPSVQIIMAPIIGAVGSFVSGSATLSNILFANLQSFATEGIVFILALQLVGAGAGNILALTNMVSAQATVGIYGKEGKIIKKTAIPFLIYISIVIIVSFFLR